LLQKIRIRQSLLAAWTNQITGDAEFRGALTRRVLFVLLTSAVAGALFMPAGFLSVSVILLMLFFLFETTTSGHRPNPVRNKLLLLPPLLFALYSFGLFYSPHQADGLQRMVVKLSLFFIPLGFSFFSGRKRESDLHVVLLAFLTGCLICSFICYGIALETIIETGAFSPEHRERAYFYYSYDLLTEPINFSPVYLSLYCNFGFIVALTSPLLNRRLRVLIACYLAVFILLIASKAGVLALLAIFLIWLIAKRKTQTWWLVTGTVCLTLIALIYLPFLRERFLVPIAFEYSWPFPHQWNSTTERLAIWSCSFETLKGHYFFGYGTGSGQFALQEMFLTKGFVRGTVQSYNPHNEFLTAWLDLGIPGLITMLAMVTIPILVAIRDRNLVALLLMVNCVLFFGVESFLLRQKGVIFFSFFYSLLFWLPNSVPRSPDGQTKGC
jgi:O-antigen ligase